MRRRLPPALAPVSIALGAETHAEADKILYTDFADVEARAGLKSVLLDVTYAQIFDEASSSFSALGFLEPILFPRFQRTSRAEANHGLAVLDSFVMALSFGEFRDGDNFNIPGLTGSEIGATVASAIKGRLPAAPLLPLPAGQRTAGVKM